MKNIKKIDDVILLNEYSELQQLMYKTTGVISPNKFVYGVQLLARKKIAIYLLDGHKMILVNFYYFCLILYIILYHEMLIYKLLEQLKIKKIKLLKNVMKCYKKCTVKNIQK